MKLPMGIREMELGSEQLTELKDSNDILDNRQALRDRLADQGYLLIRGLYEREVVLNARRVVCKNLKEGGQLKEGTDVMDAICAEGANGGFHGGRKGVTHHPEMLKLLENERIMGFFSFLFEEAAMTYDYKWLRAVAPGGSTGAHYDVVYMGRGTQDKLFTTWTPLGDISYQQGPLALCLGSHKLPGFQKVRETYGRMDVDRDRVGGWFSDDPVEVLNKFGGQWATTEFEAGDALIFGMFTMHGSIANQTDRFRISTDTRFQPASLPVDERWIGDNPIAHYNWFKDPDKLKPMTAARQEWGV